MGDLMGDWRICLIVAAAFFVIPILIPSRINKKAKKAVEELCHYMRVDRPSRLSLLYPECIYTVQCELLPDEMETYRNSYKLISDKYRLDMTRQFADNSVSLRNTIHSYTVTENPNSTDSYERYYFNDLLEFKVEFKDGGSLGLSGYMETRFMGIFHSASKVIGKVKKMFGADDDGDLYADNTNHGKAELEGLDDVGIYYRGFTKRQWKAVEETGVLRDIAELLTLWNQKGAVKFRCENRNGIQFSFNGEREDNAFDCLKKDCMVKNADAVNGTMLLLSRIADKLVGLE